MADGISRQGVSGAPAVTAWFAGGTAKWTCVGRWFLLVLVCAYFAICFGKSVSYLDLPQYTAGLSPKPFEYRVLPMLVFRALVRSRPLLAMSRHLETLHHDPYALVNTGIAFLSMTGAMWAVRRTIACLTGDAVFGFWIAFLTPFMALLEVASPWGPMYTVPYDVPALFFFALSIYLVVSGRRLWFFLVFPLAVLNRETICFASIFYLIWEWTRLARSGAEANTRLRTVAPALGLQAAIWLAIKLALFWVYRNSPDRHGLFVTNAIFNLKELLKPQQWPLLASICGFSLPFLYVQRRWIRCAGIYYACAIVLPLYFAAMMVVGIIIEIRIFTEWIALVVPALALIVHNRFRPVEGYRTGDL